MKIIATCVICFLLGASAVLAQLPTGTILGEVKDPSGAAVVGARITARNADTNQSRTAVTNEEGVYRLDGMPVGNYQITSDKEGFRSVVQSGLTLTVAAEASVNFTLQVGATSQTVEVTAEAPLVSTTTSSLGGLVDEQKIADLPLNGRNYNDLTLLQPGVTASTTSGSTSLGFSGTQYSSNGAPIRSNTYMLDGALMTNLLGTSGASAIGTTLGVDGILEYRVITNSFTAEYGMSMGSQMSIVSKSGTNQFHGDAFEFLRNSSLDARNFFDLPTAKLGKRLPEFRRNNFGGAIGGPIKKDKTFFFGVYEGLRSELGTTNTSATLAQGCHGNGNGGDVIWNGTGTEPGNAVGTCSQLGANPAGPGTNSVAIAAVMAPFLTLYPLPNIPGTTNYGFVFVQPTTEDYAQMRVDQTISNKDNLFGRYTFDQSSQPSAGPFNQSETVLESRNQFLTLAENHIFSTSLLNSVRFSVSRTPIEQANPVIDPRLNSPQFEFVTGVTMGPTSVGTLAGIGTALAPREFKQNIFTWSDDLDYTRGNHSLKFGAIVNHFQDYILTRGEDKGQASFGGVASFLMAQLTAFSFVAPGGILDRTIHFNTMGFYGEDSWRITPRLTLNMGMRYEPITQFVETHGIQSSIHNYLTDTNVTVGPYFTNPSLKNFSPRFGFAWDVFGDGKTAVRGGFVLLYDLATYGSELMNSAGYDSPFATVFNTPANSGGTLTVPYVVPAGDPIPPVYRGIAYNMNQPHMLQYNLAIERQLPGSVSLSVAYAGSHGINLLQVREGDPTLPNGIPSGGACVAQPIGTPINLASQFDGSATSCFAPTVAGKIPLVRINPAFASTVYNPANGNSFYNALQVGVNKRLSKGLQLQSAYTWSKLIDNTQGGAGQDTNDYGEDMLHLSERAPSSFDVTQNWRLNLLYHLPTFTSSSGLMGKLVNGWWASGIYSLQSGYPFNVFLSTVRSLDGQFTGFGSSAFDRPDLAAGRASSNITSGTSAGCGTGATRAAGGTAIAAGSPLGTPTLWYDPCAFTIQPQGFLGNLPRNYLRGPGLNNLNISIVKDTAARFLGEGGKVEFRAEFFNVLNHANFSQPNGTDSSGACGGSILACGPSVQNPGASAGTITTAAAARQIQFGLKILF